MQRVMIVGQPGSGKSTLAQALGKLTWLPVVHIDTIHWQPGWVERSPAEKTRLCLSVEAGDQWIFEGGHSTTWGNRVARADLLIWVDRSTALRFWRVLVRAVRHRGRTRPDLPEDCPEQLGKLPEFFRFIWATRKVSRDKMQQLLATAPPACRVVRLRSNRQTRLFLATVGAVPRPPSQRARADGTTPAREQPNPANLSP